MKGYSFLEVLILLAGTALLTAAILSLTLHSLNEKGRAGLHRQLIKAYFEAESSKERRGKLGCLCWEKSFEDREGNKWQTVVIRWKGKEWMLEKLLGGGDAPAGICPP